MKAPELNRVYSWRTMPVNDLDVKIHENYPSITNGVITKSNNPTYRYAKNYRSKNKSFSLVMVTHDKNVKNVEAFLDKSSSKVKESTEMITPLDIYYGK